MKNVELGILFIDIAKTAGTAITTSFQYQYPAYLFEGKHHSIQNFLSHGSAVFDDYGHPHGGTCSEVTAHDLQNHYSFSVIRNPYDRMVSLWLWGCRYIYSHDFNQFVRDVAHNKHREFNGVRYRSQADWICDAAGNVRVQHLLSYEALAGDFPVLLNKIGIDPFPLQVRNTAFTNSRKNRMPFLNYYTSKATRQTVEALWAADFQLFNYDKIANRSVHYGSTVSA